MIPIYFDKLYNCPRDGEPCFVSIPFAQGKLTDLSRLALFQDNEETKIQAKATGLHKDGSIKYLHLRFLANLPANQKTQLSLSLDREVKQKNTWSDMLVSLSHGFRVSTGKLTFEVEHNTNHLFSSLEAFGCHYAAEAFCGPFLETTSKDKYTAQFSNWQVIESGEVCVILSCEAKLTSTNGEKSPLTCEVMLSAYADKSWVEVSFRLINTTYCALEISSYDFSIETPVSKTVIPRTCVGDSNYKTNYQVGDLGETVTKEINASFLINQSNEHFAEVFYGTLFADWTTNQGGICATVFQAHQNFPKSIEASKKGIHIYLVPKTEHTDESDISFVTMQSGMAREQRILLHFHDASEELSELNNRSTIYQMPDRPYLDFSVYENADIFPDIFVHEKEFDAECALIQCADAHARAYGMLNWGDAPDPNYSAQGRGHGRPVWTNNEYDFPHACMLLYAKTGIRRFMDYALVSGMHQIDVDVCHFSDDPLIYGGQWEHTHGHIVDGCMVCSHQWVEGILDCYHLTGDQRFYDTAIGIGENILRLLDTSMYQKDSSFNARETGWALRSLTALYTETYDMKWNIKSQWIVHQFIEWSEHYGGWLAPYLDNVVIRVPFMISVAVGSLMRYYREFPNEEIKSMILHAVDDLLENCLLDNGLFFYKELPSLNRLGSNPLLLEALAIAYELTCEPRYLQAGIITYKTVLLHMLQGGGGKKTLMEDAVLVGTTGTKQFAQTMIPVATFYKALERASLLSTL